MTSDTNCTVTAEQNLRLIGPDDLIVPLPGELTYRCADPYAVTLSLDAGTGEPIQWTFARDLLAAALHAPEGTGDVRAWMSPDRTAVGDDNGPGAPLMTIVLGPPDACARFEVSAPGIAGFLARTYELVPAGQEGAHLDFDAELTELLGQA